MSAIRSHPLVPCDVREALDDFRSYDSRAADEFEIQYELAFARIADNPYLYGEADDGNRHCPIHGSSYSILYVFRPDGIWIRAVTHEARRPGSFSRRKP